MSRASFIELYSDSIPILTSLTSEILEKPDLKKKYPSDEIQNWTEYVKEMLQGAEKILKHSVSSSKTYFTILSHIAIHYIEDQKQSENVINQIIAIGTVNDSDTSMLRLDVLINLLNLIDAESTPKLHASLFVKIIKYALETNNYRRIVFPAEQVIRIITEYSKYKLPNGETGEILSKEDKFTVMLTFASIYEKLNRRIDAHHIFQEYLNLTQSADNATLGRVVANVVKSSIFSEIEALKNHKIIASSETFSKLLDSILSQNVSTYNTFYNENKDFVDGIKELKNEDILKTVRIFAIAKLFSTEGKSTFTYEEVQKVLDLGESQPRSVEVWIIKGVESKVFKAHLNPNKQSVFVTSVAFSKATDAKVTQLKSKLIKINEQVKKSVDEMNEIQRKKKEFYNKQQEKQQEKQEKQQEKK